MVVFLNWSVGGVSEGCSRPGVQGCGAWDSHLLTFYSKHCATLRYTAWHVLARNLVRDAEAIPVDLWAHVKDIRGMLSRAKVGCHHWALFRTMCDPAKVFVPTVSDACGQVWSENVRRQFLQASTQRPARRVDPSSRTCKGVSDTSSIRSSCGGVLDLGS